jgi:hypothetical protein
MNAAEAVELPAELSSLFWEYEPGALLWPRDQETIARRILESGPWNTVKWLRREMGDAALRDWILEHEGRNLTPRQLRYWQIILDLPKRTVDAWVARERGGVWNRRTGPEIP